MKSLNIYLEGLLNKSNKSSVLNAGDEIATIIGEKAAKTNTRGSVDWDPAKKVLSLKGEYSDLLDGKIIDLIKSIPRTTLYTDFFRLYTPDGDFPNKLVIDFDIKTKMVGFFISYCNSTSIENCTFEITDGCLQTFDMRKGNLYLTNVKFIGNRKHIGGLAPDLKISMRNSKGVPVFKNVELQDMSLVIICPAWKKYSDGVKECIENGTEPGDVMKTLGLDGITKENFRDLKKPYIEIKCPFRPGAEVGKSMKISRVKPKTEKYIEQNGWFIYFS